MDIIFRTFFILNTRSTKIRQCLALSDIDWLIIMGGPMSVNDENAIPLAVRKKRNLSGGLLIQAKLFWEFAWARN